MSALNLQSQNDNPKSDKAWIVTVDMGYGHQRAVYPLRDIANREIINANNYEGIPDRDRGFWESGRKWYEEFSRLKGKTFIGDFLFDLLIDKMQRILPFYPRRDLSKPNFQVKQNYALIKKFNWGKDLIQLLKIEEKKPLITSFFNPAFFADYYGYKGKIYCLVCDADISRAWAPEDPQKSRIHYLAPNKRVVERLRLYGVKKENIFLTGFPLPKENLGGPDLALLKADLSQRIRNLDPEGLFIRKYRHMLEYYLGKDNCAKKIRNIPTLTFAVGGAGAQRDLGLEIIKSLSSSIKRHKIKVNLVAGVRNDVYCQFKTGIVEAGLKQQLGQGIKIIYATDKFSYFAKFNKVLRTTDILWTKPSELSFYTALGLPIIIAPPLGSQEVFNMSWLKGIGSGISQNDPKYTSEWLFDYINSGWLAEAALQGYLDAIKLGTYNIENLVLGKHGRAEELVQLF